MDVQSPVSMKTFSRILLIGLIISAVCAAYTWTLPAMRIIFCDVGQGDGAYIRIQNQYDVIIDAGPDDRMLTCLGKYMPFYDHTIELAIMTHPQQDHMYGFIPLLGHYDIEAFAMNPLDNESQTYQSLMHIIDQKHIAVIHPHRGSVITFGKATLVFHWPSQQFLDTTLIPVASATGSRTESARDYNDYSYICMLTDGRIRVLFTGDAPPSILDSLPSGDILKSDILKIPHHGSVNGLTTHFLKRADPTLTVISVGKHNRFNHPSPGTIRMLNKQNKLFIRTDEHGTIVIDLPHDMVAADITSWLVQLQRRLSLSRNE